MLLINIRENLKKSDHYWTPVDEEQNINPESTQDRTQKILFSGVVIVGLATFVFGFLNFKTSISAPFRPVRSSSTDTANPEETGQLLITLRSKDTDKDGISDYDELYGYNTSPYLADSDSDGITDSQEIQQGTDPNCPSGQTCSLAAVDTNTAGTNASSSLLDVLGTNTAAETNVNANEVTVQELRTTLKNAGAPAATIDALDDATLLSLYRQVVTEAGGAETLTNTSVNTNGSAGSTNSSSSANVGNSFTNAAPANNSATTNTDTSSNTSTNITSANTSPLGSIDEKTLHNLTPDQIRQFLREGGADEAALQQIDDATLNSIFQEALQSAPGSSN